MEMDCLLPYTGPGYFPASLSEPVSCIAGSFHASYHNAHGSYAHTMGIREGGRVALLAAAGPMGLAALDYALHAAPRPSLIALTDVDDARLARAERFFPAGAQERMGLHYLDTRGLTDPAGRLLELSGAEGFDDVFVFAPVREVVETADRILGRNGCLNFFAGPTDPGFAAQVNFYNVHYADTHIVGTSGGNRDDMVEALQLMSAGRLTPAVMITHVGGLDAVVPTTLDLPNIPGGKKLIYTHIRLELTAIADFRRKAAGNPPFAALADIVEAHQGLWCVEAEEYLLAHAPPLEA
jgi:threonine dehydrogenase-like Zn-dependent dehydrogenase